MTRVGRREAVWWAQDYLFASRVWIGSHLGAGHPDRYTGGELRPVLIIPGVYENWRFMLPLIEGLHDAGHPVHVLPDLGHNVRPIAEGAQAVGRFLEARDLQGVAVVAHSKGGLIGKLSMTRELAGQARIDLVVAICTPFGGARLARYLLRVDHIGLPNIVLGDRVCPEVLQDELTPERLCAHLLRLWDGPVRHERKARLADMRAVLGGGGAMARIADAVHDEIVRGRRTLDTLQALDRERRRAAK